MSIIKISDGESSYAEFSSLREGDFFTVKGGEVILIKINNDVTNNTFAIDNRETVTCYKDEKINELDVDIAFRRANV